MTKVDFFSAKGVKKESVNLPKGFEGESNPFLIAQTVRVLEDNSHIGTSYAKTRAEVNATGAKVWKQKGTGNARHGSRRAPIFVGGGKAHGPKGIKRVLRIPLKMKKMALLAAINLKAKTGSLVLVDSLSSLKKTKEAGMMMSSVIATRASAKKEQKVLLVLSDKNSGLINIFRNIKNAGIVLYRNLDVRTLIKGGLAIFDNDIFNNVKESLPKAKKEVKEKKTKKDKK